MKIYNPNNNITSDKLYKTKNYNNASNILKLCFNKVINNDISNIILSNINKYYYGNALFDNIPYIYNNKIIYDNKNGNHPFEHIIRLLLELNITDSFVSDIIYNNKFNIIMNNIKNINNHENINLYDIILYIINKNNNIIKYLSNQTNFYELLFIIDKYILNNIILNNKCVYINKIKCNNCNYIYKYVEDDINININNDNNIQNTINNNFKWKLDYDDSLYSYNESSLSCTRCNYKELYIKKRIFINKYLIIGIDRIYYNNNTRNYNINDINIIVSEILYIPFYINTFKYEYKFKLKFIVFYKDNNYSIIINKNNKWLHYYYDNIINISFTYILNNSKYINNLIYIYNN